MYLRLPSGILLKAEVVKKKNTELRKERSFALYWNICNEIKTKKRDEIVAGRKAKVINLKRQDCGMGNDLAI